MGEAGASKVRYTRTQRGARKAIYDGYMYVFHRVKKDGEGWQCDQRGKYNGRTTVFMYTVLDEQPHSHGPDWGRCRAEETVQSIKRAAETSRATTVDVVQAKVARVSDKTAMMFPKFASRKKMVRRVKRKNLPVEPKELADSEDLPRKFTTTITGDRWLLHFDPYWVMDGTLKVAPNVVYQV
ncbi:hypothetical protein FOCC_FOCC011153 [Frankliniella occidentalis]|nr:hypothetical protein FOCC_FOCC011153 [Frankliniella occidentalis]